MANATRFVELALPLPVDQVFTYQLPDSLRDSAQPGCRAFVSFRNRLLTGVITKLTDTCPVLNPKSVLDLLDTEPIMDRSLLDLTRWMADYYLCPWGEAIKVALPAGLLNEGEQLVALTKPCPPEIIDGLRRTAPGQALALSLVAEHETLSVLDLKRRLKTPGIFGTLRNLEARGLIQFLVGKPASDPGIKTETWVELTLAAEDAEETIRSLAARAPKQARCLNLLLKHDKRLTTEQLRHLGDIDPSVVRTLADKHMVETSAVEVFRDPYRNQTAPPPEPMKPTVEQALALETLQTAVQRGGFEPILLFGVTGSGKTHVYTETIRKTLFTGRAAIVLVPELALTPQTVQHFRAQFGDSVAVLHSGLSTGERFDSWRQIKSGKYRIVVGARSAVFAPVPNLGLIVVDEEHEPSYKQFETAPLYHARDVAIMRAHLVRCVILMGSATPALETFANTQSDKFQCIRLTERVDKRPLPEVHIVDMREEHGEGNWSIFSRVLVKGIKDRLEKEEQVILFLNRRGFSTFIQCHDCGHTLSCPDCSVTLTYHADSLLLRCHYCDYRLQPPDECPKCRSQSVKFKGVGTQRVEEEIKKLFPDARIARMDMDTTTRKGAHQDIYQRVATRKADILIGTQMVAKGFDFPHVTLVGVISADTALNLPDFRASERSFQLLTQVAGRTGRGSLGGEVIVQTYSLDHHSIVSAQTHDYLAFYVHEIAERRELGYPPFGRLVAILFQGKDEKQVTREAQRFGELLRKASGGMKILGPAPSVIARVRGAYRWHLLVRSPHSKRMRDAVSTTLKAWQQEADRDIQIRIDVDPIGMM